jgi:3-phosphoglycerate kinase
MLAIYFAVAENQWLIGHLADTQRKNKQLVINLRSDSKTSIEQLQGVSKIRDALIQRICNAIKKLLEKTGSIIIFSHLERTRNIAGLFLDQRKRRKVEEFLMHQHGKRYYSNELRGFVTSPYGLVTA